ncbi:hypothetical protein AB0J65_25015 [Streptomyces toxytricini]
MGGVQEFGALGPALCVAQAASEAVHGVAAEGDDAAAGVGDPQQAVADAAGGRAEGAAEGAVERGDRGRVAAEQHQCVRQRQQPAPAHYRPPPPSPRPVPFRVAHRRRPCGGPARRPPGPLSHGRAAGVRGFGAVRTRWARARVGVPDGRWCTNGL